MQGADLTARIEESLVLQPLLDERSRRLWAATAVTRSRCMPVRVDRPTMPSSSVHEV